MMKHKGNKKNQEHLSIYDFVTSLSGDKTNHILHQKLFEILAKSNIDPEKSHLGVPSGEKNTETYKRIFETLIDKNNFDIWPTYKKKHELQAYTRSLREFSQHNWLQAIHIENNLISTLNSDFVQDQADAFSLYHFLQDKVVAQSDLDFLRKLENCDIHDYHKKIFTPVVSTTIPPIFKDQIMWFVKNHTSIDSTIEAVLVMRSLNKTRDKIRYHIFELEESSDSYLWVDRDGKWLEQFTKNEPLETSYILSKSSQAQLSALLDNHYLRMVNPYKID